MENKNKKIKFIESMKHENSHFRKIYIDYPIFHISNKVLYNHQFSGSDVIHHRSYYVWHKLDEKIISFLGIDVKDRHELINLFKNTPEKKVDLDVIRNDYISDLYFIGNTINDILQRIHKFDNNDDLGSLDNRVHIPTDTSVNYYGVLYEWISLNDPMKFIPRVKINDTLDNINKKINLVNANINKISKISKKKDIVWVQTYGNNEYSYCNTCHDPISKYSFDMAHNISKKMLGDNDCSNLIALCAYCNNKMSTIEYDEYKKIETQTV
jgi:uncharacterized CHY-type Zn-finger protein